MVAYFFQLSILWTGDVQVGVFLVLIDVLILSASCSPARSNNDYRTSPFRRRSPLPGRPPHAPIVRCFFSLWSSRAQELQQVPDPSNVLGVFGLSIRTQEPHFDEEFSRFGRIEKVTIVYNQRVSGVALGAMRILKLCAV